MNEEYWNRIENIEDHFISYLLMKEGKSLKAVSIIRNQDIKKIERDIIKSKIEIQKDKKIEKDFLLDIISLNKNDRIEKIKLLSNEEKEIVINEIYKRYTNFKTTEDRMILIWLIGELNSDKLLPFLRMELKSNSFNQKRLACSALGKLNRKETKNWLEPMINDNNPQVRQYAIKALKNIGDMETINLLLNRRNIEDRDYVKVAIDETIISIKNINNF